MDEMIAGLALGFVVFPLAFIAGWQLAKRHWPNGIESASA
jgi:hypothetical protein